MIQTSGAPLHRGTPSGAVRETSRVTDRRTPPAAPTHRRRSRCGRHGRSGGREEQPPQPSQSDESGSHVLDQGQRGTEPTVLPTGGTRTATGCWPSGRIRRAVDPTIGAPAGRRASFPERGSPGARSVVHPWPWRCARRTRRRRGSRWGSGSGRSPSGPDRDARVDPGRGRVRPGGHVRARPVGLSAAPVAGVGRPLWRPRQPHGPHRHRSCVGRPTPAGVLRQRQGVGQPDQGQRRRDGHGPSRVGRGLQHPGREDHDPARDAPATLQPAIDTAVARLGVQEMEMTHKAAGADVSNEWPSFSSRRRPTTSPSPL